MEKATSSEVAEIERLRAKIAPFFKEIRKRVIITAIVFILSSVLGLVFNEYIIRFVVDVLSLKGVNIVFTSPFQFINLAISCGIASGIIITFPLIILQILLFLRPALNRKEFRRVLRLIPISLLLFAVGFVFGAFIMKWQIEIFLLKSVSLGIGNVLDISKLISTVILVSVVMGLAFQFPLIMLILLRFNIVKHHHLGKYRLWIYIGSLFLAILLPIDSIIADILLALPLVVLFEATLLIARIWDRKK